MKYKRHDAGNRPDGSKRNNERRSDYVYHLPEKNLPRGHTHASIPHSRGKRQPSFNRRRLQGGVGYNTPLKLDADSNSTTILYTMLPKKSNIWKRKGEAVWPRLYHIKTCYHNYCISTSSHNLQVHKFPPAQFLQPSSSWSVA